MCACVTRESAKWCIVWVESSEKVWSWRPCNGKILMFPRLSGHLDLSLFTALKISISFNGVKTFFGFWPRFWTGSTVSLQNGSAGLLDGLCSSSCTLLGTLQTRFYRLLEIYWCKMCLIYFCVLSCPYRSVIRQCVKLPFMQVSSLLSKLNGILIYGN